MKILVVGNSGVGKTTALHRYKHGKLPSQHVTATLGIDVCVIKDGKGCTKAHVYDVGGLELYRCVVRHYFPDVDAVVLMYDIGEPCESTLVDSIEQWWAEINHYAEQTPVYIVGNNYRKGREVPPCVERLSAQDNVGYEMLNGYTGENVIKVFNKVIKGPQPRPRLKPPPEPAPPPPPPASEPRMCCI